MGKSKKDKEEEEEDKSERTSPEEKKKKKKKKDNDEEGSDNEAKGKDTPQDEDSDKKKKKKKKDKDKDEEAPDDKKGKDSPDDEKKKKKKKKDKDNEPEEDEGDDDKDVKKKKKKKDKDEVEADDEDEDEKDTKKKKKKKKDKGEEEEDSSDRAESKSEKKKKKKDKEEEDAERAESKSEKKKKKKDKEDEDESDRAESKTEKKKKKKDKDKDDEEEEDEDEEPPKKEKKKKKDKKEKDDTKSKSKPSTPNDTSKPKSFPKEIFEQSKLFQVLETVDDETLSKVRELVDGDDPKVDVNNIGDYHETYLHVLAAPRSDEQVNKLIPILYHLASCGMNINAQDMEGNTALHICAMNDVHHSIANTLIKLGLDPCILNCDDQDAMDLATNDKIKSVIGYFDPGLWRAIEEKNEDVVKVLVDSSCVIDIEKNGKGLLELAEESGNEFIKDYVVRNRATIRMAHVALSGNVEILKKIIKEDEKNTDDDSKAVDAINYDVKDWSFLRDDFERTPWPLLAELIRLALLECAMLIMKKADVNVMVEPRKDMRMPLFLWAIRYTQKPELPFLKALLKRADLTLIENPMELLYEAWCTNMPADVVTLFVKQGISFTQRDHKGYTLRDKIFMDTYSNDMNTLRKHLYWVDQHVLEMAAQGKKEQLENMLLEGYEYILVSDMKGKTSYNYAKKAKEKETAKFLKDLPTLMHNIRSLHHSIKHGNLQETKKYLEAHDRMERARDKGGRSPLHIAVLYERRFIIKHIVKAYPHCIHDVDNMKRTPLHLACALEGAQDIEDCLLSAKANQSAKDRDGRTPIAYKLTEAGDFIETERNRQYGTDVYLMDRYLAFVNCIENGGDEESLDEVRGSMSGIPLDEFNNKLPRKFRGMPFRPLLFVAIENKNDGAARWLIGSGCDYNIATKFADRRGVKRPMTVLDAASSRNLDKLVAFIKKRMESARDEEKVHRSLDSAFNQLVDSRRSSRMSDGSWGANSRISNDSGYRTPPQKAWMKASGAAGMNNNNRNSNLNNGNGAAGVVGAGNQPPNSGSQACIIL